MKPYISAAVTLFALACSAPTRPRVVIWQRLQRWSGATLVWFSARSKTAIRLCILRRSDRRKIVGFLLANKADVNAKNEDGRTPLIVTAGRGRIEGTVTSFTIGADSLL